MTAIFNDAPFFWPSTVKDESRNNPQKTFGMDNSAVRTRAILEAVGCNAIIAGVASALFALPVYPLALSAIAPSYFLCKRFEQSRATNVLNQLAIDHFTKSIIVPKKVMEHILNEPQALNQLLKKPAPTLNKIDDTGKSLLDHLLIRLNRSEQKPALTLLINKIKPLNSDQIFKAWKTENENIVPVLKSAGIDINQPDATGITPLMRAIEETDFSLICFLLSQGADVPQFPPELKIEPSIRKALNQAQKWRDQGHKSAPSLHQNTYALNIFKPAIKVNESTFCIRDEAIFVRSIAVASVAIVALIPLAIAFGLVGTVAGIAGGLAACWLCYKNEWSRATKALDTLAIKEFQNMFPSSDAMRYISKSPEVLKKLVDTGSDMDKLDTNGSTLLQQMQIYSFRKPSNLQIQAYKTLIDGLLTDTTPIDKQYEYLVEAINTGKPEILQYLLSKNEIKVEDLSSEQQFNCIKRALYENAELIHILMQNKFDVNAKNIPGQTPLFHWLFRIDGSVRPIPKGGVTRFQIAQTLLKYKPNLQCDFIDKDGQQSVTKKITDGLRNNGEDLAIRQLIEQSQKT
jgi:ankyrin repeat protein